MHSLLMMILSSKGPSQTFASANYQDSRVMKGDHLESQMQKWQKNS